MSSPLAFPRRFARRTLPLFVVAVAVVWAIATGALLGDFFNGGNTAPAPRSARAPQTITHEGLHLALPSDWAPGDAPVVPGFRSPLGLRDDGDRLRASVERLPATSTT